MTLKHFLLSGCALLAASAALAQSHLPFKRVTPVTNGYPMLSPDGKRLVFESDWEGSSEIYTMNVDGSDRIQLTFNRAHDESPVWSPDGTKIVFASLRDGDTEIYLMDADGGNQTRLTQTPGDDSHPKFSADGKLIVFNSARTTPDLSAPWNRQVHEIFAMNLDGSGVRQLTQLKSVTTFPSLSPDGRQLLFRHVVEGLAANWDLSVSPRNSEVFVMNLDGTELRNLSHSPAFDGWPTWTPDGRVVFSSNRAGRPGKGQLYVIGVDGTGLRMLTDPEHSFVQHAVTFDGRQIYAQSNGTIVVLEFNP